MAEKHTMKLISHQGTRVYAPENSLPGYRKAVEMGYYALNFAQVRASKDGTLYLMHDETVDRTTDGTGELCELTDAELNALTLDRVEPYGVYSLSDFTPEELRVPTLEACVALCRATGVRPMIRLGIELKDNKTADDNLRRIINAYNIADTMILSGSPEVLAYLDETYPGAPKVFFAGDLFPMDMINILNRQHWQRRETVYVMLRSSALLASYPEYSGKTGIELLKNAGYGVYSSNPGDMTDPEGAAAIYRKLDAAGCDFANAEFVTDY